MLIWYFVLSLNNGVVALPQVDHDQCIQNRALMKQTDRFANTFCIPGKAGVVPVITGKENHDDD